ncbi:hypothetical protein [Crenobacter caeni]|uniref:Uncharacterized protein n=1 Tax=Crenobacter caeni TaxID=2705474 RepID=A0A6B2KPG8_9NEIS|nr:hypothetical protein [Crenobacter caeni]NDV12065.1 hypothetical protein [Crenobacter caeni]
MNRHERELKKQLLLIKGEALRTRVELEVTEWKNPLQLARSALATAAQSRYGMKAGVAAAALFFPRLAQKGLFRKGLGVALAVLALRRWLKR